MADITYIINENSPQSIPGFEQYSNVDKNLIDSFEINSLFDSEKHFAELHVYSLTDQLLESDSNYSSYKFRPDAGSSGKSGASNIVIDPIQDSIAYGYPNGGVKLLYHFINDIFTQDKATAEFFISDLSGDRTELRLLASTLDNAAVEQVAILYAETLKNESYFDGFRLNFGNNDLLIGINIGIIPYNNQSAVIVKLYEPLPDIYDIGATLNIVEVVSDSIAYEVESQTPIEIITQPYLRPANFNIDTQDNNVVPSQYFSYDELFSYPINNSNSQIYSVFNEKGIDISVDYTDYSSFVHFSSAQERLINFKYKLDLITQHSASLSSIASAPTTLAGTSGSKAYYNGLIQGIVSNFDHYERFLYYESGSNSWPKLNTTKPYTNAESTTNIANTWYNTQLDNVLKYDSTNNNALVNTIPAYLRDDTDNENYVTFINMIGQHFDNLWLYGKAVTDKYNADNRIDFGIPKDLVGEALKNFGVKLYTSNKSIEDLFTTIIGQPYQSGSEKITNYITGSYTGSNAPIQPTSYDSYQKEIQKRLYHNLPLLLNSKGTERGLRALINCYGIPSNILDIKYYGGRNTTTRPFFGDYQYFTSSLDKIRLDHTGSIATGSTLSGNTSIIKRDTKYTDDLHNIEVGFSPTDNIDAYIISQSAATFNIDDYIGDPRDLSSGSYSGLYSLAQTVISGSAVSGSYDLQDYVRLIKFFDNTIFKTIKDFIPARVVADTGIIIKPNLLNRSKAKSVTLSGSQPEYTASIDTAFIVGRDGSTFGSLNSYMTSWTDIIQTPTGLGSLPLHAQEEPRYNGEFSGSELTITDGNLIEDPTYLSLTFLSSTGNIRFISESTTICALTPTSNTIRLVNGLQPYQPSEFFSGIPATGATYQIQGILPLSSPVPITAPFDFSTQGFNQYDTFQITATDTNILAITCERDSDFMYGICSIVAKVYGSLTEDLLFIDVTEDSPTREINLSQYFTISPEHDPQYLLYTVTKYEVDVDGNTVEGSEQQVGTILGSNLPFIFNLNDYDNGAYVYITVEDTKLVTSCTAEFRGIFVASCTIETIYPQYVAPGPIGRYYYYSTSIGGLKYNLLQGGTYLNPAYNNSFRGGSDPQLRSPIHNTAFQYVPGGTVYNMPDRYPYLQNPNYIFQHPDGTPRTALPVVSYDIQAREMGLASFFKGLKNLAEIQYEVNIYRVPYLYTLGNIGLNLFSVPGIRVYSATDDPAITPYVEYGEGIDYPKGRIRPGQVDTYGVYLNGVYDTPIWTYDTPAPPIGESPVQGFIAKLSIPALQAMFKFGTRGYNSTAGEYYSHPYPYGYLVKIDAYTTDLDPNNYPQPACFDTAYVVYENWIPEGVPGGGAPDGTPSDGPG